MALTSHGFWSVDQTTPLSIQAITASQAAAAEAALAASEIRNGVPKAASESALNALFSGTNDPVSGLPLAPVDGSAGMINGTPVFYDGTRWWGPGYTWAKISKTASVTTTLGNWTLYNALGTTLTDTGPGSGLTLQVDGIKVLSAGVYDVEGVVRFPQNSTGYRIAAISIKGGDFATSDWVSTSANFSQAVGIQVVRNKLVCNANDVISIYGYTGGVALSMSNARLTVTRVN